jgi:dynein intermediate chain 1
MIFKTLGSGNPQAAQNFCQFSFKLRQWETGQAIDQMVYHVSMDGAIVMKESEEAVDQEDYWDTKISNEKKMLEAMNKKILEEYGNEPFEGQDDEMKKKSLRNQFNYQERAS